MRGEFHLGSVVRQRLLGIAVCVYLGASWCTGCSSEPQPSVEGGEARAGLAETATNGDASATVRADRGKVRVAEALRLTLEVRAPADAEVELPRVPELLKDFVVRKEGGVEVGGADGARTWRQTFELDSSLSGQKQIPAMTFVCGGKEVTTAPLAVEVVSAMEGDSASDPSRFADIEGPVAIPKPWRWTAAYVAGPVVLALAGLVWLLLRHKAARAVAAPPPPPHVWALRQLDALVGERLVQRGLVHEFYYRLSGIVRTYIELRFGLMAPERTTEEFLVEVRRGDALRFGHQELLGEFLTACDLVKYARHEPPGAEIDASVEAARRFVRETAPAAAASVTGVAA